MKNDNYTINSLNELTSIPKYKYLLHYADNIIIESNIASKKLILDFQLIPDLESRLSEISKNILNCIDEYLHLFRQFRISKDKNFITPIIEKLIGIIPKTYIGISNDIIEFDVITNLNIKEENSIKVITHYLLMLLYNDGAIEYCLAFLNKDFEPDEQNLYIHSLGNTLLFPKKLIALLIAYRTLLLEKEASSTPPEQTPQTKPKGKVTFKWLKSEESRDLLYNLLINADRPYIDKDYTSIEAFREVFSGNAIKHLAIKVKWLRNKNELQYLIDLLAENEVFISETRKWNISSNVFVFSDGENTKKFYASYDNPSIENSDDISKIITKLKQSLN